MKKCIIFARVSSSGDRQDYQRQINDLTEVAKSQNLQVDKVFAEKISGGKKNNERKELMAMIDYINGNSDVIEKVMVTELSRLGRNTLQVLKTIETLNENRISLFIQNFNIETLTPTKEVNPMSSFLITILAEVAQMERKTIQNRLKSGYDTHRKKGGKVGRKVGYRKSDEEMLEQYAEEIKLMKKGYSYNHISQLTNTNKNTLTKLKMMIDSSSFKKIYHR